MFFSKITRVVNVVPSNLYVSAASSGYTGCFNIDGTRMVRVKGARFYVIRKKVEYLESDFIVERFALVKVEFGNSIYLRLAKFEQDSSE